jgi:hypothetical protein
MRELFLNDHICLTAPKTHPQYNTKTIYDPVISDVLMIDLQYTPVTFPPKNICKCLLHSRPGAPIIISENVLECVR